MLKFTELKNLENSVKLHAFTVTDISFSNKYYVKANILVQFRILIKLLKKAKMST